MKLATALLAPAAWCAAVTCAPAGPYGPPASVGTVVRGPLVVERRYYSPLPRDPATTQDVDIGHVLVGTEAPATVDVYALTEDPVADIPVVSIDRRVAYPRPRRWYPVRKG